MAWLETGLSQVIKTGSYNAEDILESAEFHLHKLQKINLDSMMRILSLTQGKLMDSLNIYKIKNIKPVYLRLSMYSLIECFDKNNGNATSIPLSEVAEGYDLVKRWVSEANEESYRSFYRLNKFLLDAKSKKLSHLEDLGVMFNKSLETFVIFNQVEFEKFRFAYNELKKESTQNTQ